MRGTTDQPPPSPLPVKVSPRLVAGIELPEDVRRSQAIVPVSSRRWPAMASPNSGSQGGLESARGENATV